MQFVTMALTSDLSAQTLELPPFLGYNAMKQSSYTRRHRERVGSANVFFFYLAFEEIIIVAPVDEPLITRSCPVL